VEAPLDPLIETDEGRPQLLFLCQTLPYPPDSGVLIRAYNVLRLLSREFDVTALCFYRVADRPSDGEVRRSVEGLQQLAAVEAFPIPQEHNKVRLFFDHFLSVINRRAYTIRTYESREFRKRLRELMESRAFNLVHMDSLDLAGYLPSLTELPVVCVHHNVESALLQRRAATMRGFARAYVRLQARFTLREERRWCPRVALNVTVSEADREVLANLVSGARFIVVPNGVDTRTFEPGVNPQEGIVFVGTPAWQPNRDAMEYFCVKVLPRIRERGLDPTVTWIGRAPESMRLEYSQRFGVNLTGYLHDVRPLVQAAACYVAPLRAGGGTRLKILDAWAMGKAVVSTSVGCEGLLAHDGENILIRDTPESFADAVADVLADKDSRDALGRRARETVESHYDWEVIGRQMLDHYRRLINQGRPAKQEDSEPNSAFPRPLLRLAQGR
jgi:polysaccharide biosynthesis protein PslH